MRCPYCGSLDTQVKDSRPTEDASSIRRRRVCPDCGGRFTTFERVQLRELTVLKKSGRRVPFERDKLMRSLEIALRKRPVEPERVERMVNGIVRQLESQGDSEMSSERIGELVMEGLKALDSVAYVRFASVYRNFREARDFGTIIDELAGSAPELAKAGRTAASDEDERAKNGQRSRPAEAHERAAVETGAAFCRRAVRRGLHGGGYGSRPARARRDRAQSCPSARSSSGDGVIVGRGCDAGRRPPACRDRGLARCRRARAEARRSMSASSPAAITA